MSRPIDASLPLSNAGHERFAQERAKGKSAAAAYRLAGYKPDRGHAARLAANGSIVARIEALQRMAATSTVLTIAEKREFIARVVRSSPSAATMENADCELVMTKMGPVPVFPSKAALIKLDNDLAGDGSDANREGVTVVVTIGGQE